METKIDRCGSTWKPMTTRDNSKQMRGNATILSKDKIGKVVSLNND